MARGDEGIGLRIGSFCSGVAGLDMGLSNVGRPVWFCEAEPFPQAVLRARFPGVPVHPDMCTIDGTAGAADLLCGGIPCQPASVAGKRKGADDERWLWGEVPRVLKLFCPRYAVWENPTGLLSLDGGKAFGKILDDHEEAGYGRVAWVRILASDVGAPHRRARVFILAVRDDIELGAATGQVITDDPLETWVRHVVMALQGARVGFGWGERDSWPTSGLTPPGGGVWQLPDLTGLLHDGRLVDAACWPTPQSQDWKSGSASEETRNRNARPLNEVVLWPTPRSSENDQGRGADAMADGMSSWLAQGRGATLTTAVARWPTPTAALGDKNVRSAAGAATEDARGHGGDLGTAVLWPTPTRQDGSGSGNRTGNPDSKAHAGTSLVDATQRGLWSTPTSSDANGTGEHGEVGQDPRTQIALWSTPTAALASSTGSACADHRRPESLASHVKSEAQWPTPSATPYGSSQNGCPGDGRECYAGKGKPSLDGMARKDAPTGRLNPEFVECLMGFDIGWTDVEYGKKSSKHSTRSVRTVRCSDGPQKDAKRRSGGRRLLQEAPVLQPDVLWPCTPQGGTDEECHRQTAQEGPEKFLRDVWWQEQPEHPSCGREQAQQCCVEPDDAMPVVPHEVALAARQDDTEAVCRGVRGLRKDPEAGPPPISGHVRHALCEVEEIRRCVCGGAVFSRQQGIQAKREPSPWPGWPAPPGPQHAYEPPRLTDVSAGRPQRLRALGNSCVPMVAALVGLIVRRLEEIRVAP